MRERIIIDRCFVARKLCTKYNTRSVNRTVAEIVIDLDKNKTIKRNVTQLHKWRSCFYLQ